MNNGVPQLKKLTVRWCNWGGSSRGMLGFIQSGLVPFARENPAVEIVTELKRGKHPALFAEYITGYDKSIGVKLKTAEEIRCIAENLRNTSGRKMLSLKKPVVAACPSIQGRWTAALPCVFRALPLPPPRPPYGARALWPRLLLRHRCSDKVITVTAAALLQSFFQVPIIPMGLGARLGSTFRSSGDGAMSEGAAGAARI